MMNISMHYTIVIDPNVLNNNNTTTDNIATNNLNNLMDIKVKNQFNVQNIIDRSTRR